MKLVSIDEVDIKEKRVLIRVDFNVPLTRDGEVRDDSRIRAALPTINYAIREKARVIIASHLGRPAGKPNAKLSLMPVGRRLSELLDAQVFFPEDCVGDAAKKIASEMPDGSVMLLENLRFQREEEENSPVFAKRLASIADVYVNEAFSVSHRAHASTAEILNYREAAAVGFQFIREIEALSRITETSQRPFVAVFGGRSASEKIPLMESLLEKVDSFLVGGAVANTFVKAMKHEIGNSSVDEMALYSASKLISSAKVRNIRFALPDDFAVIKSDLYNYSNFDIIPAAAMPKNGVAVDIGGKTSEYFSSIISRAKTVFWNGVVGVVEKEDFRRGTEALARSIADSGAFSVAAGWDTVAAIEKAGLGGRFAHLSMGGQAALDFIAGSELPALSALRKKFG
ncbi:MAG: phosphoglycerate kinase [Deltaproteobacteria bacterium]